MLEEAAVFHRKNGIAQNFRNVVVADGAALFPRAIEQTGQKFRLDFRGVECAACIHRSNFLNSCAAEIDNQPVLRSKKESADGLISISLPCRM